MKVYGCDNLFELHGKVVSVRCPYNEGHCTHENPAILTSTLLGAHPADCPLLKEEGEDDA